jgi:hypothetical protein
VPTFGEQWSSRVEDIPAITEPRPPLVGIWTCLAENPRADAIGASQDQLAVIGSGHEDGAEITIHGVKWEWRTLPLVRYPGLGSPRPRATGIDRWTAATIGFVVGACGGALSVLVWRLVA